MHTIMLLTSTPFFLFLKFCSDQVRVLYKGTLRVLLVLLHDFPEFLCDYHFTFCDVIPPSCIQMRNIILSAFPRSMRLPDPSTPNLKVLESLVTHTSPNVLLRLRSIKLMLLPCVVVCRSIYSRKLPNHPAFFQRLMLHLKQSR